MTSKVLINAGNLHVGGGVAVATSFLSELSNIDRPGLDISLLVSSEVNKNLQTKNTDIRTFYSYKVKDYYGISSIWSGLRHEFTDFDLIFTIFGPSYFLLSNKKHIIGFAQPWIVYPDNPISRNFSPVNRIKQKLKYFIQSLFFSKADEIIVELEHVKKGLKKYSYLKNKPTHIVNSTVDGIYYSKHLWQPINLPASKEAIKLGVISRNYAHKNLQRLPDIKEILKKQHNLKVDFFVTFSDSEWQACSSSYKQSIINAGPLQLDQCPSFYNEMDGVVFPSLLECFSATPIEAMVMKKPLFASSLPFIQDCCKEHAHYFDPLDNSNIAKVIAQYYNNKTGREGFALDKAKEYVDSYSSARGRAIEYLRIINEAI